MKATTVVKEFFYRVFPGVHGGHVVIIGAGVVGMSACKTKTWNRSICKHLGYKS
ncbi:hypothetical protein MGH68_07645 [Erysipelothrix sp. D19-032]